MADDELLSQDEIDALLAHGDDDAASDTGGVDARPYQLGREQSPSRGRLPTLEMIAERFARRFAETLREIFRQDFEVGPGGVDTRVFADYCQDAVLPVNLTVCSFDPIAGAGLLALDASLIYQLVDRYFGGSGSETARQGMHFSPTEQRVVHRVRERLFSDWDAAWQDVLKIHTSISEEESNPNLINAFAANDLLTFVSFVIRFGDASGRVVVALPYKGLEAHRAILDSLGHKESAELAQQWQPRLAEALLDAEVSVRCQIASTEVRLREVLNLKAGDILQADVPAFHQAYVDNVPLFKGKLGESAGKLALEFQSRG
ncbi:MAG: flagellar motor switch protein FliM [Pseudomonadales bacterium]